MTPKVSILIPFYNCEYVDLAIDSALNQSYDNIEIIVINDGATEYVDIVKKYEDRVRIVTRENGGTARAMNTGILAAQGEYIAWLSADDLFLPKKIEKQLTFMEENGAKASFTNYDIIDENNKVINAKFGQNFTNLKELQEGYLITNHINGCTVLLHRSVFEDLGIFNPDFKYTHDYELWFRILTKGPDWYYLDEVLTQFRTHAEAGTQKYGDIMQKEMRIIEKEYRPLLAKKMRD